MSGSTSLVSSTPDFVTNATGFGGQDVRAGTLVNDIPGLFASGDFAVSQRGAGAAMSVDIAQGRAMVDPQQATHQGLYVVRRTTGTAYNTNADGGYTWTASDPSNPRIDLLCIEVKDTDMDASGTTGWRFRVVDGTPNAGATHQLITTYWPAVPTGCVPIAAIRVPAAATTLTTANITSLNPICGARPAANPITTNETTTSSSFTRLATPDFVFAYVPANSRVRWCYKSQWKISVASGTQGAALFINSTQLQYGVATGAPSVANFLGASLATLYSHLASTPSSPAAFTSIGLTTGSETSTDASDVATGQMLSVDKSANAVAPIEIFGLAAGWYVFEMQYKTSANTLSVQNRKSWVEVVAAG